MAFTKMRPPAGIQSSIVGGKLYTVDSEGFAYVSDAHLSAMTDRGWSEVVDLPSEKQWPYVHEITNEATMGIGYSGPIAAAPLAIRKSKIGMRIVGGRMVNVVDNTATRTFNAIFAVQRRPVAVSFAIAQGRTGGTATDTPPASARVYTTAGFSNAEIDAADKTTVATVSGSGGITMPAPAGDARRKVTWTDFAAVTAVARSDGETGYLVGCRLYVNGGARMVLMGNGSDSFSGMESLTGREAVFRSRAGAAMTSAHSSFAEVLNGTPIVGVRYITDEGYICNIAAFGDSIDEGRDAPLNIGFAHYAAVASQTDALAFEASDLAWAGSTTTQQVQHMIDAIADSVIPHVAVFPSGSPNDVSTTIDYAKVNTWMLNTAAMMTQCRNTGIIPIVRTMTPANYAVKAFGASDSLRRAHNANYTLALGQSGVSVVDAAALAAGSTHASGQVELSASANLDGLHLTASVTDQIGALVGAHASRIAT